MIFANDTPATQTWFKLLDASPGVGPDDGPIADRARIPIYQFRAMKHNEHINSVLGGLAFSTMIICMALGLALFALGGRYRAPLYKHFRLLGVLAVFYAPLVLFCSGGSNNFLTAYMRMNVDNRYMYRWFGEIPFLHNIGMRLTLGDSEDDVGGGGFGDHIRSLYGRVLSRWQSAWQDSIPQLSRWQSAWQDSIPQLS